MLVLWSVNFGIGGRFESESLVGFFRNRWSVNAGIRTTPLGIDFSTGKIAEESTRKIVQFVNAVNDSFYLRVNIQFGSYLNGSYEVRPDSLILQC